MIEKFYCAVLIMVCGSFAFSADLFEEGKPRAIKYGDPIAATDTLGGYAIYPGDGHWTFVSARAGSASTRAGDATVIGTVNMVNWESRALVARQTVTANIGAGWGSSWTGAPCAPGHLVSRNQVHGRDDNCMTIDAINVPIENAPVLFFSVVITNSASNGRYYRTVLDINPSLLGMHGTTLGDWAPEVTAIRGDQQAFLKRLSSWAEALQDASNKAFDYSHPQDSYTAALSFRTLLPIPAEFVNKNVPLSFLIALEDMRDKKSYSSMAYAYVEGKPLQRWTASTGSPSAEAADAAAIKGCETDKPAELPPCVVYRIPSNVPSPRGAVRLTIVNNSPAIAEIYWVNGPTLKHYKTLPPGQSMEQPTYVGHQWRAVLSDNSPPADFTASDNAKKWELK